MDIFLRIQSLKNTTIRNGLLQRIRIFQTQISGKIFKTSLNESKFLKQKPKGEENYKDGKKVEGSEKFWNSKGELISPLKQNNP